MISQEKIERINWLSRKKKTDGLTEEEIVEQKILYREYIDAIKGNLRVHLESIEFVDEKNDLS
ncbi:MAG: DUF896 domain-containing protein [Clostridia bacterium]|jgi:5-formyltetrahydrofolate cyclo-ligase|nr:DUF896 domain-containing protein [Clostridia bacterium]